VHKAANDIQAQKQAQALVKAGQAAIESGQAAVEQARLNLGFTKVRSLIEGIAGIATTQIGNLVSPMTLLTTVSQVDPIKVYFPISEQEYLYLANRVRSPTPDDFLRKRTAVPLQLTLANGMVYPHPGRILFADRQVDPLNGNHSNRGNICKSRQHPAAGPIRAHTSRGQLQKGALLIPQRAVSRLQGRYQVASVRPDNRITIHNVQPGERAGQMWIIESGLQAGERVVAEGTAKVREGEVVHPIPDKASGQSQ
jgi:RND family efflux transporter MFP subunit